MALKITKNCEYVIHCDNCPAEEWTSNIDGTWKVHDVPSRYFKRCGWREVDGHTLCPKCTKAAREAPILLTEEELLPMMKAIARSMGHNTPDNRGF